MGTYRPGFDRCARTQKGEAAFALLFAWRKSAGGQISGYTPGVELLSQRKAQAVIANKGYDSDKIIEHAEETMQARAVVPPRSNRKQQRDDGKNLHKPRNRIERCLSKLRQFRRFAARYEKSKTPLPGSRRSRPLMDHPAATFSIHSRKSNNRGKAGPTVRLDPGLKSGCVQDDRALLVGDQAPGGTAIPSLRQKKVVRMGHRSFMAELAQDKNGAGTQGPELMGRRLLARDSSS
jgi:transposase